MARSYTSSSDDEKEARRRLSQVPSSSDHDHGEHEKAEPGTSQPALAASRLDPDTTSYSDASVGGIYRDILISPSSAHRRDQQALSKSPTRTMEPAAVAGTIGLAPDETNYHLETYLQRLDVIIEDTFDQRAWKLMSGNTIKKCHASNVPKSASVNL
jgi:hypothetical protein